MNYTEGRITQESGASQPNSTHYRTLKDIIEGLGDDCLINLLIEKKTNRCRQWQHSKDFCEKMEQKARTVEHVARDCLEELKSIPRVENGLCLLTTLESTYSRADDEFLFDQQLFLFQKRALSTFHRIPQLEVTLPWSIPNPAPPFQNLDDLRDEEVLRLCSYEITPKSIPYLFSSTIPDLLNADLIGHNAVFSQDYLVVDFLEKMIDIKSHKRSDYRCQYTSNKDIADEMAHVGFETSEEHDIIRYLRRKVLFDRIHLFNELSSCC